MALKSGPSLPAPRSHRVAAGAAGTGPEEALAAVRIAGNRGRPRAVESAHVSHQLAILVGGHARAWHLRAGNAQRDDRGERGVVGGMRQRPDGEIRPSPARALRSMAGRAMEAKKLLSTAIGAQQDR
jgi:hypothetical protein